MTIMVEPRYIVPNRFTAQHVESDVGGEYICPFCQAQSTIAKGTADTTWIEMPFLKSYPKWVCLGCCIDIYSTCLSDRFEEDPYREIVEDAAKLAGYELDAFRRACLEHQLEIAQCRFARSRNRCYKKVMQRIRQLVDSLENRSKK